MSKPTEIKITGDRCVADTAMPRLARLKTRDYLVHAWGEVKVKPLVKLSLAAGAVLACPVTGTLYSLATGRSSSRGLYIVGKA